MKLIKFNNCTAIDGATSLWPDVLSAEARENKLSGRSKYFTHLQLSLLHLKEKREGPLHAVFK